jgi:fructokinase
MMSERWVVVGLGEVLWDIFPDGPRFGGAPANFACHAAMLGADAFVVSQVGQDKLGDQAVAVLRDRGVDTALVARSGHRPTGTVRVALDEAGKPQFTIGEAVAWDAIPWSESLGNLAARTDAVCFGTLGQRGVVSRQTIRRFLETTRPDCLRVFDVNLRPRFDDRATVLDSLALANVLKLNDEELPVVAAMCGFAGTDHEVIEKLRDRYQLRLVALTRGARGATLLNAEGSCECAAPAVQVRDTVGAGDAFTAALVLGWLRGCSLEAIGEHACQVAAYVCSQAGATPALPGALRL